MKILCHFVDFFSICMSVYSLYKEKIVFKPYKGIVLIVFAISTILNCIAFNDIQPFQFLIVILSFLIIYGFSAKKAFNVIMLYSLLSSLQMLIYTLLTIWESNKVIMYHNFIGSLIMISICTVLGRIDSNFDIKSSKPFLMCFIVFSVFIEGLTMAAIYSLVKQYSIELEVFDKSILTLSFPVIMILMFLFFYQLREKNYEYDQRKLLEKLMQKEKAYYNEQEFIMHSLRKFKHDTKNYYNTLYLLLKKGNISKAEKFVEETKDIIDNIDFQIYTGNVIGDIVINEKSRASKQKLIDFKYDGIIPETDKLLNTELASLLSNTIDNAIEAAERTDNKYVFVLCRCDPKFFKLTVINSCPEQTIPTLLTTTKANKEEHGYGIRIIRAIVSLYKGIVEFSSDSGVFKTEILLKLE